MSGLLRSRKFLVGLLALTVDFVGVCLVQFIQDPAWLEFAKQALIYFKGVCGLIIAGIALEDAAAKLHGNHPSQQ